MPSFLVNDSGNEDLSFMPHGFSIGDKVCDFGLGVVSRFLELIAGIG